MLNQHGKHSNDFSAFCCGVRRKVLPGDVVVCRLGCDSLPIIPNASSAFDIPENVRVWKVPNA